MSTGAIIAHRHPTPSWLIPRGADQAASSNRRRPRAVMPEPERAVHAALPERLAPSVDGSAQRAQAFAHAAQALGFQPQTSAQPTSDYTTVNDIRLHYL